MKRCTRCILPDTIPNITFDAKGVCDNCNSFDKKQFEEGFEKRRKILVDLIEKQRHFRSTKGWKYDVLVPLSGGRDSSYVAYKLATELKLNILCVNYANPFSSKQAVENVNNIVKTIGADLVTFKYPNNIHEKSFKTNLKAWLRKPDIGTLGLICLACKPMYLKFYEIARKHNIGLIIDGSNIFEVTTFKMEAQGGKGTTKLLSLRTVKNLVKKIFKNIGYLRICNIKPALWTFLSLNGSTPYLRKRYPEITKMGYFYSFPYNEKEINEILKSIGWKKAEDNESSWRFDCEVDSLKNYIYRTYVGATEKDDLFSKYVRAGLITREEALARLHEGEINPQIVERVLARVEWKKQDFDRVCENNLILHKHS